ncbi:hypothetical protein [Pseudomonas sessilinigenes]|uniref:Uncharacterized protein n=1 Tax=Pseudomonas sessilinigenes TaxID=658629 RepID=A0ABX8MSK1_9PSED|nr:hypothetical protein [Pseudomonas sessilinigenes]AZC23245.1 hypothetical protein C4K39_1554 [Pseudomonas sessilinigenes]QXH42259.1 hypothetical protein KSS89_08580 [Pseudomonas sessilinigenes]
MASAFHSGPFTLVPLRKLKVAGVDSTSWELKYDHTYLADRVAPSSATQAQVRALFESDVGRFISEMSAQHAPETVHLVNADTDETVATVAVVGDLGLTPGLIDDRSTFWLRSSNRKRSKDICLADFPNWVAKHKAPARAWICDLLPEEVVTENPAEWRAPTSWEIRHIVGEGSLTGVPGSTAAGMVGVTPQNFRKYTAADGASTKQNMSFAMWHLLMHKLEVKSLRIDRGPKGG